MNPPNTMYSLNVIAPSQPSSRLVTLLRQQITPESWLQLSQLSTVNWRQIVTLAKEHMVASLLYTRIQQHDLAHIVPAAELDRLQHAQHRTALCNLRLYHQLQQIVVRAKHEQIVVMLLKGAHLAAAVYPTMDQRTMTDLELLVKPDQLPAFVKLLQELGYKPSTPLAAYETYLRSGGHHLPRFVKVHAPSVEVHWSLHDRDEPHSLDVEELWERAQICSIQDESVIGLSPEDLLIHVALHATNRHLLRQGIGLLCDVDAIVRHHDRSAQTLGAEEPQFDWATVVARAKACGGERGLFLALFLAERLLGTPIPPSLSAALGAPAIDERSLQDILAHLFVDNRAALRELSSNAQRLSAQAHPLTKVHYLWRRLFVPREQLALTYQIRENSSWLYLYYGKRFKDLVTGYLKTRDQMQQTEPFLRDVALQQVTILRWLEGAN